MPAPPPRSYGELQSRLRTHPAEYGPRREKAGAAAQAYLESLEPRKVAYTEGASDAVLLRTGLALPPAVVTHLGDIAHETGLLAHDAPGRQVMEWVTQDRQASKGYRQLMRRMRLHGSWLNRLKVSPMSEETRHRAVRLLRHHSGNLQPLWSDLLPGDVLQSLRTDAKVNQNVRKALMRRGETTPLYAARDAGLEFATAELESYLVDLLRGDQDLAKFAKTLPRDWFSARALPKGEARRLLDGVQMSPMWHAEGLETLGALLRDPSGRFVSTLRHHTDVASGADAAKVLAALYGTRYWCDVPLPARGWWLNDVAPEVWGVHASDEELAQGGDPRLYASDAAKRHPEWFRLAQSRMVYSLASAPELLVRVPDADALDPAVLYGRPYLDPAVPMLPYGALTVGGLAQSTHSGVPLAPALLDLLDGLASDFLACHPEERAEVAEQLSALLTAKALAEDSLPRAWKHQLHRALRHAAHFDFGDMVALTDGEYSMRRRMLHRACEHLFHPVLADEPYERLPQILRHAVESRLADLVALPVLVEHLDQADEAHWDRAKAVLLDGGGSSPPPSGVDGVAGCAVVAVFDRHHDPRQLFRSYLHGDSPDGPVPRFVYPTMQAYWTADPADRAAMRVRTNRWLASLDAEAVAREAKRWGGGPMQERRRGWAYGAVRSAAAALRLYEVRCSDPAVYERVLRHVAAEAFLAEVFPELLPKEVNSLVKREAAALAKSAKRYGPAAKLHGADPREPLPCDRDTLSSLEAASAAAYRHVAWLMREGLQHRDSEDLSEVLRRMQTRYPDSATALAASMALGDELWEEAGLPQDPKAYDYKAHVPRIALDRLGKGTKHPQVQRFLSGEYGRWLLRHCDRASSVMRDRWQQPKVRKRAIAAMKEAVSDHSWISSQALSEVAAAALYHPMLVDVLPAEAWIDVRLLSDRRRNRPAHPPRTGGRVMESGAPAAKRHRGHAHRHRHQHVRHDPMSSHAESHLAEDERFWALLQQVHHRRREGFPGEDRARAPYAYGRVSGNLRGMAEEAEAGMPEFVGEPQDKWHVLPPEDAEVYASPGVRFGQSGGLSLYDEYAGSNESHHPWLPLPGLFLCATQGMPPASDDTVPPLPELLVARARALPGGLASWATMDETALGDPNASAAPLLQFVRHPTAAELAPHAPMAWAWAFGHTASVTAGVNMATRLKNVLATTEPGEDRDMAAAAAPNSLGAYYDELTRDDAPQELAAHTFSHFCEAYVWYQLDVVRAPAPERLDAVTRAFHRRFPGCHRLVPGWCRLGLARAAEMVTVGVDTEAQFDGRTTARWSAPFRLYRTQTVNEVRAADAPCPSHLTPSGAQLRIILRDYLDNTLHAMSQAVQVLQATDADERVRVEAASFERGEGGPLAERPEDRTKFFTLTGLGARAGLLAPLLARPEQGSHHTRGMLAHFAHVWRLSYTDPAALGFVLRPQGALHPVHWRSHSLPPSVAKRAAAAGDALVQGSRTAAMTLYVGVFQQGNVYATKEDTLHKLWRNLDAITHPNYNVGDRNREFTNTYASLLKFLAGSDGLRGRWVGARATDAGQLPTMFAERARLRQILSAEDEPARQALLHTEAATMPLDEATRALAASFLEPAHRYAGKRRIRTAVHNAGFDESLDARHVRRATMLSHLQGDSTPLLKLSPLAAMVAPRPPAAVTERYNAVMQLARGTRHDQATDDAEAEEMGAEAQQALRQQVLAAYADLQAQVRQMLRDSPSDPSVGLLASALDTAMAVDAASARESQRVMQAVRALVAVLPVPPPAMLADHATLEAVLNGDWEGESPLALSSDELHERVKALRHRLAPEGRRNVQRRVVDTLAAMLDDTESLALDGTGVTDAERGMAFTLVERNANLLLAAAA